MITGRDLNEMREALGMDMTTFARLMCVHAITPSKWKANPNVAVSGFAEMLCGYWISQGVGKVKARRMSESFRQDFDLSGRMEAIYEFMTELKAT